MQKRIKNHFRIIRQISVVVFLLATFVGTTLLCAPMVSADDESSFPICTDVNGDGIIDLVDKDAQDNCRYPDELQSTPDSAAKTCEGGDCSGLITKYVNPAIKVLTGLIGVIVTISLIVGGIQYSAAGGDPGKVSTAKKRIYNTLIALVAYLFMLAFLQWLIPGGII